MRAGVQPLMMFVTQEPDSGLMGLMEHEIHSSSMVNGNYDVFNVCHEALYYHDRGIHLT